MPQQSILAHCVIACKYFYGIDFPLFTAVSGIFIAADMGGSSQPHTPDSGRINGRETSRATNAMSDSCARPVGMFSLYGNVRRERWKNLFTGSGCFWDHRVR